MLSREHKSEPVDVLNTIIEIRNVNINNRCWYANNNFGSYGNSSGYTNRLSSRHLLSFIVTADVWPLSAAKRCRCQKSHHYAKRHRALAVFCSLYQRKRTIGAIFEQTRGNVFVAEAEVYLPKSLTGRPPDFSGSSNTDKCHVLTAEILNEYSWGSRASLQNWPYSTRLIGPIIRQFNRGRLKYRRYLP